MPRIRNRLLASLKDDDLDLLKPHLESVTLGLRQNLERPHRAINAVYFPEAGFASVVAIQSSGKQIEVGMVGREGVTGLPVLLGNHRSPNATYIQAAGTGLRLSASQLSEATRTNVSLFNSLLRYAQAFIVQVTQTAVCNAQSSVEVRLARWLLMAHDRIGEDTLPFTHEFLALMLGVRRAGVTEALQAFHEQDLISYWRGKITMVDRKGMERAAGESYGVPEAEYRRLIG